MCRHIYIVNLYVYKVQTLHILQEVFRLWLWMKVARNLIQLYIFQKFILIEKHLYFPSKILFYIHIIKLTSIKMVIHIYILNWNIKEFLSPMYVYRLQTCKNCSKTTWYNFRSILDDLDPLNFFKNFNK